MGTHTPLCDLLGIEHPIVEAPLAADPRLPAAVSNAGAVGTLGLSWADDAGDVPRKREMWEAAGRPAPGSRLGEGEVIAHFTSGEPILRYSPAPPMVGTTGEIEALSLWAGHSIGLVKQRQPAAEIVAELVSRL
jgi:nitronate monooxygenase